MSELNVVVIGGVSCGPKSAARLKRLMPEANVTLIERGDYISYGGCGLPYYIGSIVKELNDLMTTSWDAVRTPEFMKATKDMNTLLGWEATKIDRDKKVVEVKNVKTGEEKPCHMTRLSSRQVPATPSHRSPISMPKAFSA